VAEAPDQRPSAIRIAASIVDSMNGAGVILVAVPGKEGRREAAASQPPAEPLPGSCQSDLDGADRHAELVGGLLVGLAFEVAQDDRRPVFLRQPIDLLVDLRQQRGRGRRLRPMLGRRHPSALVDGPTRDPGPGADRDSSSGPEEPARDRAVLADRAGFQHQDEERGLEGVLGVVGVAEDVAADPEHHRAVLLDQGDEGDLGDLTPAEEAFDELIVRQCRGGPDAEERPDVVEGNPPTLAFHESGSPMKPTLRCRVRKGASPFQLSRRIPPVANPRGGMERSRCTTAGNLIIDSFTPNAATFQASIVPEPSSLLTLALRIVGASFGLLRRRRVKWAPFDSCRSCNG
jgi:hypothetical protein